jgi:peptide/nickel transport system ATP-binding protein
MYAGRIVETAEVTDLFDRPLHPYTRGLMSSIPRLGAAARQRRLTEIPGLVPDLRKPVIGCAFAPRCPLADDRCRREAPPLDEHGNGHSAACWKPGEAA